MEDNILPIPQSHPHAGILARATEHIFEIFDREKDIEHPYILSYKDDHLVAVFEMLRPESKAALEEINIFVAQILSKSMCDAAVVIHTASVSSNNEMLCPTDDPAEDPNSTQALFFAIYSLNDKPTGIMYPIANEYSPEATIMQDKAVLVPADEFKVYSIRFEDNRN